MAAAMTDVNNGVISQNGEQPSVRKKTVNNNKCGKCERLVKENDRALECEICDCWFHTKCENIPHEVYKFMVEEEAGEQLHWNCSFCKRGCDKLLNYIKKKIEKQQINIEKRLCDMQEEISSAQNALGEEIIAVKEAIKEELESKKQMEERVCSLESKLLQLETGENEVRAIGMTDTMARKVTEHVQKEIAHIIKSKPDQANNNTTAVPLMDLTLQPPQRQTPQAMDAIDEFQEREKRKRNLVLHILEEPTSDNPMERKQADIAAATNIISELGIIDVKITKSFRPGRLPQPSQQNRGTQRPRPLVITVEEEKHKWEALKKAKNLCSSTTWSGVYLAPDRTPYEREETRRLLAEIRTRKANGETDLIIKNRRVIKNFRTRGPPDMSRNMNRERVTGPLQTITTGQQAPRDGITTQIQSQVRAAETPSGNQMQGSPQEGTATDSSDGPTQGAPQGGTDTAAGQQTSNQAVTGRY